ncbi:GNAT family N-acetyltransferase [Methanoculleus oceani]|uniref:GNAT family N-acetyltransferase n=1 Tax=Methanoculleus oceani TaxID=2184756 RepID=A0ABD4TAP9_9EURY|nr:N-acetyltransferase [Methanoculleus sp. CWC-02]MCM2465080.1 GNAT family N-acetyltransferase [Methanoculleus sp. CWC-02]
MAPHPVAIRPEAREDYPAVHDLIRRAFGREGEARLVEALRKSPGFIPDLSLVAETDGRVVGHILFSPVRTIEDGTVLALAPVAVDPSFQRQGIGSALVFQGLAECRRLGYGVVIVVGHPGYYPRFGFVPAREKGFAAPFPVPDEAFMMLELRPGAAETVGGLVLYPPVFELCDEN